MKIKIIVILLILGLISIIFINKNYFVENNIRNYKIVTYIDGKLANSMPSSADGYIVSNITCSNGALGNFNYSTWKLEISNVISNTSCIIDFVTNDNTNFNTYLIDKTCSSTPTSDSAAIDCLVSENGLRYEGSNPNNYVLFNDELWRIIGVFDSQITDESGNITETQSLVKIVRYNLLEVLAKNGNSTNDWSISTLKTQLNDGYLNATDTICNGYSTSVTKTCKFSNVGLNKTSRDKIENVVWNLGGMPNDISDQSVADVWYSYERDINVYDDSKATSWSGKIALMYPSDYGYAVLASNCSRSTALYDYDASSCANNNWLFPSDTLWLLTPRSDHNYNSFKLNYIGDVMSGGYSSNGFGILPTAYLKSTVKYISGTGTYSDPYIIS